MRIYFIIFNPWRLKWLLNTAFRVFCFLAKTCNCHSLPPTSLSPSPPRPLSLSLPPSLSALCTNADISLQHHQRRGGRGRGGCVRWKRDPLWLSSPPSTGSRPPQHRQPLPAGGHLCRHTAPFPGAKASFLLGGGSRGYFSNFLDKPFSPAKKE